MSMHSIEVSEEAGVRYLHFGSEWVQGAMRVARPTALELEYTRDMALLLAAFCRGRSEALAADWAARIVQVGLGAASLTKHIARAYPAATQTVLEINPQVVAAAKASFGLVTTPQVRLELTDASVWMATPQKPKRDCILVDGYDQHARFGALGSEGFYRDCHTNLHRDGALILNLFGRSRGYHAQLRALHQIFNGRVLALPAIEGGNAVVLAIRGAALSLDLAEIDIEGARAGLAAKVRSSSLQRLRVATGGLSAL
jgi:spermidine synthase